MNKIALGLTTAAALTLGAGALYAAPGAKGADANNDGAVTWAEAQAKAGERWARMDANKDGMLNAADRDARMADRFAGIDTDKNGSISREEFTAHHRSMLDGKGPRGMGGHEGHAMGHDMGGSNGPMAHGRKGGRGMRGQGMGAMAAMADTNKDGAVSKAEFDAGTKAMFDRVDANKDGRITKEERQAARAQMRQMRGMRAGQPGAPAASGS